MVSYTKFWYQTQVGTYHDMKARALWPRPGCGSTPCCPPRALEAGHPLGSPLDLHLPALTLSKYVKAVLGKSTPNLLPSFHRDRSPAGYFENCDTKVVFQQHCHLSPNSPPPPFHSSYQPHHHCNEWECGASHTAVPTSPSVGGWGKGASPTTVRASLKTSINPLLSVYVSK